MCIRDSLYTPNDYVGALMDLCQQKRGVLIDMKYLDDVRVDPVSYTHLHCRLLRDSDFLTEIPDAGTVLRIHKGIKVVCLGLCRIQLFADTLKLLRCV